MRRNTMNTTQPLIAAPDSRLDSQPLAVRPLNEAVAGIPSTQRHYSWGPASEIQSGRFFTGRAWGPKTS